MINNTYKRLDKDVVFMEIANILSKRSHDSQTQHGCVLVKDGRILSTGYNGFIAGANDAVLPNTRPDKYPHVIHSEANAIINAAKQGVSIQGSTLYITGPPCLECTKMLLQAGITDWVVGNRGSAMMDNEYLESVRQYYIQYFGVQIKEYRN